MLLLFYAVFAVDLISGNDCTFAKLNVSSILITAYLNRTLGTQVHMDIGISSTLNSSNHLKPLTITIRNKQTISAQILITVDSKIDFFGQK